MTPERVTQSPSSRLSLRADLVNFTLSEPETGLLTPGSDAVCALVSGSVFTKVFMPVLQGLLIAVASSSLQVCVSVCLCVRAYLSLCPYSRGCHRRRQLQVRV